MSPPGSRSAAWHLRLISLGLAVASHVLWGLMPRPQPPPAAAPLRSVLRPLDGSGLMAASPTLFSLPSPLGFSALALELRPTVEAPLESPVDLSFTPPLPLDELRGPDRHTGRFLQPETPPVRHTLPMPENLLARTVPGKWTLRWMNGTPEEVSRIPFDPPPIPSTPHTLTGILAFDVNGGVESLVIDPPRRPIPPGVQPALRRLRIPPELAPLLTGFELHVHPGEGSR